MTTDFAKLVQEQVLFFAWARHASPGFIWRVNASHRVRRIEGSSRWHAH